MDDVASALSFNRQFSAGEAVTVLTASALVFSVIYNFGYFSALNTSFVALLTPQDLVLGAAVAFIPTALLFELGIRIERWIGTASKRTVTIAVAIFAVTTLGAQIAFTTVFKSEGATTLLLAAVNTLLATGYIFDVVKRRSKYLLFASVASVLWSAVYGFGQANFQFSIVGYNSPRYKIETDKTISGTIIRETSNFTFLYDGTSVMILPNSTIKSIEKLSVGV